MTLTIARSPVDTARHIAAAVAAPAADAVDREGRFPHEAIAALREERLLGAAVTSELGGLGASIGEIATICESLGRACPKCGERTLIFQEGCDSCLSCGYSRCS